MAKDPAVLWYWSDWHSGTSLMSRFLKGCYMDLLHAQFNHGPLSLENIKQILGMDFGNSWPSLQKKFSVNPEGLFLNERMEYEKNRRRNFLEKQSLNGKKGGRKAKLNPTLNPEIDIGLTNIENENRIEDENNSLERGVGENLCYNAEDLILGNQIQFETICTVTGKPAEIAKESLRNYHLWLEENEKYPKPKKSFFAGFEKWLRNEKKFNNGTHQQSFKQPPDKPGTSKSRIDKARSW